MESEPVPIKFALLNIQGLSTKLNPKLESEEVKLLFSENDCVLFTESWGNEFTDFHVQGLTHFVLNRTEYKLNSKRSSGGIVLYLRDSLIKQDSNPLFKTDSGDIIWLKLDNNNSVFSNELYIYVFATMFPREQADKV